jgi:hypothetical protein
MDDTDAVCIVGCEYITNTLLVSKQSQTVDKGRSRFAVGLESKMSLKNSRDGRTKGADNTIYILHILNICFIINTIICSDQVNVYRRHISMSEITMNVNISVKLGKYNVNSLMMCYKRQTKGTDVPVTGCGGP